MRGDGRSAACCFLYACGFAGRPQTVHASPASRRPPMLRRQAADRLRFASKPQTACVSSTSRRRPVFRQQAADRLLRRLLVASQLSSAADGRSAHLPPGKDQPLANKFARAALPREAPTKLCTQKNTKSGTKYLRSRIFSCILAIAVTLIAMKREVAARCGRFSVERMSS